MEDKKIMIRKLTLDENSKKNYMDAVNGIGPKVPKLGKKHFDMIVPGGQYSPYCKYITKEELLLLVPTLDSNLEVKFNIPTIESDEIYMLENENNNHYKK